MRKLLKKLIAKEPQVILTTDPAVMTLTEKDDYSLLMEYRKPENPNCRYAEIYMAHLLKGESYITLRNNKYYSGAIDEQKDYRPDYAAARKAGLYEKLTEIAKKEDDIKLVKRFTGYENAIAEFQEYNKDIDPQPSEEFIGFIRNEVLPGYALYSNKEKQAECTKCGKTFDITKLKKYEIIRCPYCGKELLTLPKGKFVYSDICKIAMFERHGNKIVLRYFKVTHNRSSTYKKQFWVDEVRRDFFELDTKEIKRYIFEKYKASCYTGFIPNEYEKQPFCFYQVKDYWYSETILWKESLKALEGTELKYALWEDMNRELQKEISENITGYLEMYFDYPFIETFIKTNRLDILKSAMKCKDIQKYTTQPSKALGIPRNILRSIPDKIIREYLPRMQLMIKNKVNITERISKWANEENNYQITEIKTRYSMDTDKVITYLDSQRKNRARSTVLHDYFDYLNGLEKLNIIKTKNNLYPKDFYQAHDEVTDMIMKKQEKANEELYMQIKAKSKFKEMIIDGLIIRLPKDTYEIKKEGIIQHNCVGTYIGNILLEKTNVLFLRKENEPDKPYITAEIRDDKIMQARYKANRDCKKEIYDILKEYIKETNKNIKKKAA